MRFELGQHVAFAHELLLLLLLQLTLLAHAVDVTFEVRDGSLQVVAVLLDILPRRLRGAKLPERGVLRLVDPPGFQLGEVNLVILRL